MAVQEITIYGTVWCGDCLRSRRYLDSRQISYDWIDIDRDPQGERFVLTTNHGMRSVPTIVFPNGMILVEPTNEEIKEMLKIILEN